MTTAPVKFDEIRAAFDFVNAGGSGAQEAYICLDTGKIYWLSDWVDPEDPPPEGMDESDRYLAIPSRNKLELGRALVLSFIEEATPNDYHRIRDFFSRRGAYARFEDFLEMRGLRDKWHAYEHRQTEAALRAWCVENGIELTDK
jgi:hypothetical protein